MRPTQATIQDDPDPWQGGAIATADRVNGGVLRTLVPEDAPLAGTIFE
jgi:hypothetical protein